MNHRFLFFVPMFLVLLSGCNKYVLITKQSTSAIMPNVDADITSSDVFKQKAPTMKTVAYRPPDTCLNQGAAQADGTGTEKQKVMQTACGVWLKELERAFVGAGYNVTSWQTLIPAGKNTLSGDAFIETAKNRGVDVVFLVNSLTIDEINPGKEFKSVISFKKSDSQGSQLGDFSADPTTQTRLLLLVPEDAALPAKQEAATFDVTAIDVQTAQAIWFYRQTVTEEYQTEFNWSQLAKCNRDACLRINQQVEAAGPQSPQGDVSMIVTNTKISAQSEDDVQRHRQQLIQKTVENFIEHFAAPAASEPPVTDTTVSEPTATEIASGEDVASDAAVAAPSPDAATPSAASDGAPTNE